MNKYFKFVLDNFYKIIGYIGVILLSLGCCLMYGIPQGLITLGGIMIVISLCNLPDNVVKENNESQSSS